MPPAPFQPIRDYHNTQHVLGAPSLWIHPVNGNAYTAIIEQIAGVHQDLAIYRLPGGASAWQEVKRYHGTIDSSAQIAFGSVAIGQGGNMIVVTSLVIPGVPPVTTTGFQGVWLREPGIDAPYPALGAINADLTALIARLVHLEATDAQNALEIARLNAVIAGIHAVTQ